MAEKKGICRNYVNCPLADKEEIQIVDDINFVCQHCHQPLEPADNNTGGKGGFDNKKKLLLKRIGIATVAIGLVVGGYFLFSSIIAKKEARQLEIQQQEKERVEDSISRAEALREAEVQCREDSLRIAKEIQLAKKQHEEDSIRIADSIAKAKLTKPVVNTGNWGTCKWKGVATYEGPMQGGKPHGGGGALKFQKPYTLDLKDGVGGKLEIRAGDGIRNAKCKNGELIQGELQRNNGNRKWFNIGA